MNRSTLSLVVLCGVQFVDVLGVTVVVAALPRMLADLGAPAGAAGLLVPTYAVGFASLLLVTARLGDRYGHRRMLLAGLALFALASILAAVAPHIAVLVAARGLQGLAAAVSIPNALVLLTATAPDDNARSRRLGVWNACGGLAGGTGLVIGGLVTSAAGWRPIFAAMVLVAVVLAVGALTAVPPGPRGEAARIDLRSVALQVAAVALVVAGAQLASDRGRVLTGCLLAAAGLLLAVLLVQVERRARDPLVPRAVWSHASVWPGLVGSFAVTATTSSLVIVITLYLQDVRHLGAAAAGLLILPFSVAVIIAATLAGRLVKRVPPSRLLLIALVAIGAGALVCVVSSAVVALVVGMVLAGLGNGAGAVSAYALALDVPTDLSAAVAGLLNTAAQLGTAVVVAVVVAVAAAVGRSGLDHRAGWVTVVVVAALAVLGVGALRRREYRTPPSPRSRRGPARSG